MMTTNRPIRVLHVLGALNQGGVETWLLHVVRNIDRAAFQVDFLVHSAKPAAYDDDVRALGSRIFPCLNPQRPWRYGRNFKAILRQHGPYDVVHSHVHDFSGFVLRLARQTGVPVRIAHSHCDTTLLDRQAGLLRQRYLSLMKHWINRYATTGLGCSRRAAACLFGADWQHDLRWKLYYCGIDLTPFLGGDDRNRVREEFQIPQEAFLVGHIGRFDYQKNHRFLIEVIQKAVRTRPQTRLLLIGDGPLRPEIEQQVDALGLREHVIFAGLRRDVPCLLSGMDVFLLPSHFEGLPIVMLEAQASGLPCVISDTVDEDADVIPGLVRRLSLSQPVAAWAEALAAPGQGLATSARELARQAMEDSPFNIRVGVEKLQQLYREQLNSATASPRASSLLTAQ